MGFNYRETQIVKGMIERGDKRQEIAAYFGERCTKVEEVINGVSVFSNATALPVHRLPPKGPYVKIKSITEIEHILYDALELIEEAGDPNGDCMVAIDALKLAVSQLKKTEVLKF